MNEPQPELSFRQDGGDLVVTTVVGANNSPHVLWARVHTFQAMVVPVGGRVEDAKPTHRVSHHYYVFQNRDLYRRSRKEIEVTWRLAKHLKGGETYEVVEVFDPDSAELRDLLPRLEDRKKVTQTFSVVGKE